MALFLHKIYTENGQTLYDGVFALPGAHHLTVTAAGVRLERYFFAQLTHEIIGSGGNGLYLTSPITIRTRGAQLVLQTFARSFTGHLN